MHTLLTFAEAATELRVSPDSVRRLVAAGKLLGYAVALPAYRLIVGE